jgi:preprotein translocase subunit SecB
MNSPVIQSVIKLMKSQVLNIDFKLDPNCIGIDNSTDIEKIDIELKVTPCFNETLPNDYSISFDMKINSSCPNYLILHIESMAYFQTTTPINDEFKESAFVNISSPAIAFPFLRSFINTLTSNAGMAPIILPAFNFATNKT